MEVRERLALRKKVIEEEHLDITRGVQIGDRNEKCFSRPNELRENAGLRLCFRVGDLDLPERKNR